MRGRYDGCGACRDRRMMSERSRRGSDSRPTPSMGSITHTARPRPEIDMSTPACHIGGTARYGEPLRRQRVLAISGSN